MTKKPALIALFGVLALAGCGKPKATPPAPPAQKVAAQDDLAVACRRPVFRTSFTPIKKVTLEQLAARGAKQLRLAVIERYNTLDLTQKGQTRHTAIHFRSVIAPQSTAEKLEAQNEILCRDMAQLPTKVMNDAARVPLFVNLNPATLGEIPSDVELTVKVPGSQHKEVEGISLSSLLPFDSHWQKFTERLGKQMDQYALYEITPNRFGMFSEIEFRSTRYLVNEQTNQTAVFSTLTHTEYTVE